MRTRVKIEGLSAAQWDRLQDRVQAEYRIPEGAPRVCAIFQSGTDDRERHIEMPVQDLATVLTELTGMDAVDRAMNWGSSQ